MNVEAIAKDGQLKDGQLKDGCPQGDLLLQACYTYKPIVTQLVQVI
jgi:hypothetical protein